MLCSASGCPALADGILAVLAVRTAGYTKVFKVLYRHTQGHQVPNRLGLQPMVTANTLGSGGHSDVAFNPWYSRQFGTVDQKGNWGVWDIEGAYERSRKGFGLTLKYTTNGRVTCGDHKTDGWGQIKWGGDLNTVVACDRHTASLFDIRVSFMRYVQESRISTDRYRPRLHPPTPSSLLAQGEAGSSICKEVRLMVAPTTHISSHHQMSHGWI